MNSSNPAADAASANLALTATDQEILRSLDHRLKVIRDRVRGVAEGHHTGFYLFGRPGTSKTHTIRTTLETLAVRYQYHDGHLTPMGLFELLEARPDSVVVLDDVSAILRQPVALQLLLAALGRQPDNQRSRTIKYKRQGREAVISFTGGIICVSNLSLDASPLLAALKSRVHYLQFDPTDEQIAAMMRCVARKGWPAKSPIMTPAECRTVTEFLIAETHRLKLPLDMRMLMDKAFPDFHQHRSGHTETNWKDLVLTTLQESLVDLQHTPALLLRADKKMAEHQLIREIMANHLDPQERIGIWTKRTGKSNRAYYRRLAEIDVRDTVTLS